MTSSFSLCNDIQASQYIKAFWQAEGQPGYHSETILPKGVVELIFSFGDKVQLNSESNQLAYTPRCFVSGMRDTPLHLIAPPTQVFFGIELRAAAVKKLLQLPSGSFLNAITDIENINPEFSTLWHMLAEEQSFEQRATLTQKWLSRLFSPIQERELTISGFLNSEFSPTSVSSLASEFCYSQRQLNRKSAELFGMSTESLIGYKRYVHALHLMHHSNESLTRIGYHCHYYDQAHFIREFKDYTGLTPGDYRQNKGRLAGHLYQ